MLAYFCQMAAHAQDFILFLETAVVLATLIVDSRKASRLLRKARRVALCNMHVPSQLLSSFLLCCGLFLWIGSLRLCDLILCNSGQNAFLPHFPFLFCLSFERINS